jgi:hypothetical protein
VLISAGAAFSIDVDLGGNVVPNLPATTSVGAILVARLSAGGTLIWSDIISRSDQAKLDPGCCELKAQDLWSIDNSTVDSISTALIRATAWSNRVPSYLATGSAEDSYLTAEQAEADLVVTDAAPTAQDLTQQYLMGWRFASVKYIRISDAANPPP